MADSLAEQFLRSRAERRALGKRLRKDVPRSSHGRWQPAVDRPDPLDLLQAQDEGRIKDLLPIKYGRMAASPFAFLRGSAAVMAADLANTPASGQPVLLCGDAHLSNFGLFATPERNLVFDINDFDECHPGPWEWDLKRLATSAVIAGRANGFDEVTVRQLGQETAEVYRKTMRRLASSPIMESWYFHIDAKEVKKLFAKTSGSRGRREASRTIRKAKGKTQERTFLKMTHMEDGRRILNHEPPLLVPLRFLDLDKEMAGVANIEEASEELLRATWSGYVDSLPEEQRYLLQRFRVDDIALRVGGVGSVGTHCFIFLLGGAEEKEGLILQLKSAGPSALQDHLQTHFFDNNAQRVVIAQRLMQAASDPFLGWNRSPISSREFYWRQLKDMKGSIDVARLEPAGFRTYIALCAASLARAHARTGDPVALAAYMGKNKTFDRAIADFAVAYADQTERDHALLLQAIEDGRIPVLEGI